MYVDLLRKFWTSETSHNVESLLVFVRVPQSHLSCRRLPLVFPNTSESVNTVATQPIIGDPEPSFKLEAYFNGPKLPFVSCLINIVDTLMTLGLEDFSGNMEKVT